MPAFLVSFPKVLQLLASNGYNGYNGGGLQPGCWAYRLLTGLGQPQISKLRKKNKNFSVLLRKEIMNKLVVDLLQQKGFAEKSSK